MSVRGFTAAFRRACGKSPARYITEIRVREAAHLVLETVGSIDAIAERTGFPEPPSFQPGVQGSHGRISGAVPATARRGRAGEKVAEGCSRASDGLAGRAKR